MQGLQSIWAFQAIYLQTWLLHLTFVGTTEAGWPRYLPALVFHNLNPRQLPKYTVWFKHLSFAITAFWEKKDLNLQKSNLVLLSEIRLKYVFPGLNIRVIIQIVPLTCEN